MTDEMERGAEEIFAKISQMGSGSILEGIYAGIENGYFQGEIAESAYRFERKINTDRRIVVGVNRFTENDDDPLQVLYIGPEVEERQLKRLADIQQGRDDANVEAALAQVTATASDPERNLMPAIIDAVRTDATLGEVIGALEAVFGRWHENPVF